MPLYMANTAEDSIDDVAKARIAADITRIHCAVTDAPEIFVHAFFVEDAPHMPLNGQSVFLVGSIRAGRNAAQKVEIVSEITESFRTHAGIAKDDITVVLPDTPASWVMEGGEILPEPGEEEEWLALHQAKLEGEHA